MKEIEQHVENDQYTLKDMKEHIEKNHIEVMNEIASMKKSVICVIRKRKVKLLTRNALKILIIIF